MRTPNQNFSHSDTPVPVIRPRGPAFLLIMDFPNKNLRNKCVDVLLTRVATKST